MSAPALNIKLLRVYVVEPQALLGKALCRVLAQEPHVLVVGESALCDPHEIALARPDVIVLDPENYISNIDDFVGRIRDVLPQVRICVLSSQMNAAAMMRAINAGVDGYVSKSITPAELVTCIKKIETEGFYADARLTGMLLRKGIQPQGARLSRREVDVAKLVAEGLSNKQIAMRLLVSDKTVKNHIANIFSKLEITARTQIAVYVVRNGIA